MIPDLSYRDKKKSRLFAGTLYVDFFVILILLSTKAFPAYW